MADIMTLKEAAEKWNVSPRRINELVLRGKIEGAYKIGTTWVIPADTKKPTDQRIKSGNYKKDPSEWKRNKKITEKDDESE